MKRGRVVIASLTVLGVGALGILEVSAAPQAQREAAASRRATPTNQAAAHEGGIAGGGTQPDVTVSRVGLASSGSSDDIWYYGVSNVNGENIRAFALASTSCNIGNQPAEWMPGGRNPVIAQNLYRYLDGKFEQISMSWLKHSFCAVNESTCGTCSSTPCSSLGVGCADTYWATLNGDNSDLGPRWNINPQGLGPDAVHNDIYNLPTGPSTIRGRLQVKDSDIIAGSQYVAEIQYVTHDEPYENRYNNASYRLVNLSQTSMSGVNSGQASVAFGKAGIFAWKAMDNSVQISIGNDLSPAGRFHVGVRVYDNGDGTWDYEYAVHNLNSYRGARSFSVPVSAGLDVSNIGFHDVDYHSGDGENYVTRDGTDWLAGVDASNNLVWETATYAANPNANALLWGTLYNFRFTANAPPVSGAIGLGLFRPGEDGQPSRIQVNTLVPGEVAIETCAGDTVNNVTFQPPGDGVIDGADLAYVLGAWGNNPGSTADMVSNVTFQPPGDGVVDGADLAYMLGHWGTCD